jgi:hypothetical protein
MIVTVDPSQLVSGLALYARKLPYAAMVALNRSDEEVQARLQQELFLKFTVRNPTFMQRLIKIKGEDRATTQRLVARVRIEGPEGDEKRGDVLTRHIDGGTHTKAGGGYSIDPNFRMRGYFFIPTEVLRFPATAIIPKRLYPANLRLVPRKDIVGEMPVRTRQTKRGAIIIQGKLRTFVLNWPNTDTPMGVFQRGTGAKGKTNRTDINLIWYLSRSVRLKPRFPFYALARRTFEERWPINMRGAWDMAKREMVQR